MSNSGFGHIENMKKVNTCVKKLLPWESRMQNRRLACYMLQCLGTIHLAALRPHCRMFLHSPSPLRSFFNISPY